MENWVIGSRGVEVLGRTPWPSWILDISEVSGLEWIVCTYWYLFHYSSYSANGSKLPPWSPDGISSAGFSAGGLSFISFGIRSVIRVYHRNALWFIGLSCICVLFGGMDSRWKETRLFLFRWGKLKVLGSIEQGRVAYIYFFGLTQFLNNRWHNESC